MGLHADLIEADLGDIDLEEMAEHFRAIASLTDRQVDGMLGWAQQEQADDVYNVAYAVAAERADARAIIAAAPEPQPFAPGETPF